MTFEVDVMAESLLITGKLWMKRSEIAASFVCCLKDVELLL